MRSVRKALLDRFPDSPQNLYPRAQLLLTESVLIGSPESFAVIDPGSRVIFADGLEDHRLLRAHLPANPHGWSILSRSREAHLVAPGWHWETALFYHQGSLAPLRPPITPMDRLSERELTLLPTDLRDEIATALSRTEVFVSREGNLPVSFAYVTQRTESLFDISVDTLEPHRRRGHARIAAARLIANEPPSRKAHWGALVSNLPSQKVALSLGFTPSHRLWACESP